MFIKGPSLWLVIHIGYPYKNDPNFQAKYMEKLKRITFFN